MVYHLYHKFDPFTLKIMGIIMVNYLPAIYHFPPFMYKVTYK